MSKNNNGGSAFPVSTNYGHIEGMTLRDWFASQALNGLIANGGYNASRWENAAKYAYECADAMLKAREAS